MPRTWVIIDSHYLAHRAGYALMAMEHQGVPTGAVYGFLAEVNRLADRLGSSDFVFAFDSVNSVRRQKHPRYKPAVPVRDRDLRQRKERIRRQIDDLRRRHLPALGFRNVLYADGFEADDIIARIVLDGDFKDRFEIVSADNDLYQLLRPGVRQHRLVPGDLAIVEDHTVEAEFGVGPDRWAEVKAIAGCSTDNVPGVYGVGVATAARYLAGKLPTTRMLYGDIHDWVGSDRYWRALELVKLPYPGCPEFDIVPQEPPTAEAWRRLCDSLGFDRTPGPADVIDRTVRMGIDL